MIFTQVLPRVLQALSCFQRIQQYCTYHARPSPEEIGLKPNYMDVTSKSLVVNEAIEMDSGHKLSYISLPGHSYRWKLDGPDILKSIGIDIPPGVVTAVVGPVGSGKSTLLETILGETIDSHGPLPRRTSQAASMHTAPRDRGWQMERFVRM